MSDHLRFLVTVESSSGVPVKVEQVGEGGDLAEVDLDAFLRSLGAGQGGAGATPQVVVNIYTTGARIEERAQAAPGKPAEQPERLFGWDPSPPPPPPPPDKKLLKLPHLKKLRKPRKPRTPKKP